MPVHFSKIHPADVENSPSFDFLVVPSAKLQRDTASRFGKSALAVPTSGIAPKLYGFSSRRVQSFNSGGCYLPLIRNPLDPFASGAPRSPPPPERAGLSHMISGWLGTPPPERGRSTAQRSGGG